MRLARAPKKGAETGECAPSPARGEGWGEGFSPTGHSPGGENHRPARGTMLRFARHAPTSPASGRGAPSPQRLVSPNLIALQGGGVAQEQVPIVDDTTTPEQKPQNRQRIFPFRALSGPPSSPINAPNHRGLPLHGAFRRGGRVVECTALEMRHRCKPIGGSNPSLSATLPDRGEGCLPKLCLERRETGTPCGTFTSSS